VLGVRLYTLREERFGAFKTFEEAVEAHLLPELMIGTVEYFHFGFLRVHGYFLS